MDFNDTPKQAEFRSEATTWLAENIPTDREFFQLTPLQQAKRWQKHKYDSGWACLGWAPEYGGRGASVVEEVIWRQEEAQYSIPQNFFVIGQGMIAPTLMTWASEEDKARYLPRLASGEEVWCQLFSEPASGSDLAALRTRAECDGDEWVLNGQKIWTSGAHYSDFGIIIVRTNPDIPKHKGLSFFFIDMKSPGIEIKPIKQLTGESDFNEVFFEDVRVPDQNRLGEVGQGWQVALTTLMNERAAIGANLGEVDVSVAISVAKDIKIDGRPAIENSAVRSKIANWYVQESGLNYSSYRTLTALSRGDLPGPENSIGKLVAAHKMQAMSSYLLDLMDYGGVISDKAVSELSARIQYSYMSSAGLRIAGGTDEIMSNIIAERVLGLPQEPRADKGIPFKDVPTR